MDKDMKTSMIVKRACDNEKQKPCREEEEGRAERPKGKLEIDIEVDMKPETKTTAQAERRREEQNMTFRKQGKRKMERETVTGTRLDKTLITIAAVGYQDMHPGTCTRQGTRTRCMPDQDSMIMQ